MNTLASQPRERSANAASDAAAVDQRRPALAAAAERSLQLLLIAAALTAIVFVLIQLRLVVLPVIAAVFLATALAPIARWLRAHRWPAALAALTTMGMTATVFAAVMAAIVPAVAAEIDELGATARAGLDETLTWLTAGPIGVSERDINQAVDHGLEQLRDSSDLIAGGVISGALLIGELIAGVLLTAILLFFFLKDGDRLWKWLVQLAPTPRRSDLDEIGRRSWTTVSGYLGGISIVALIDAVLIGVALAIIGVPIVLPLMVLTFAAAYIPLVGAVIAAVKQDLDRQIDALEQAEIPRERIYVDKKSGATTDRPGLREVIAYAREGDVIVVHTLDRLGRTVRDTLNLIHELAERKVGVRNLADPIKVDSSSPEDPMAQPAVVLLALFGQMERTYTMEARRARPRRRYREGPSCRPAGPDRPGKARVGDAPARHGQHDRGDRREDRHPTHKPLPPLAAAPGAGGQGGWQSGGGARRRVVIGRRAPRG